MESSTSGNFPPFSIRRARSLSPYKLPNTLGVNKLRIGTPITAVPQLRHFGRSFACTIAPHPGTTQYSKQHGPWPPIQSIPSLCLAVLRALALLCKGVRGSLRNCWCLRILMLGWGHCRGQISRLGIRVRRSYETDRRARRATTSWKLPLSVRNDRSS